MLTSASYEFARARILDGDVIVVRGRGSLLAAATRLLLSTPYTHTAIALWLDGHVWLAEMTAKAKRGNVLVPLAKYEHCEWDVFSCPVKERAAVRELVFEHLDPGLSYGFGDLLYLAWCKALHLPQRKPDNARQVCSSFTAHVLREAGWEPAVPLPPVSAPSDVAAALGTAYLEYRPGG